MRRWQKLFWISVTVLAVVSLAGALARPAIAQIRAAVVKNIDEKGRIAYQASVPCIPDPPSPACNAVFPVVPANKRLVIEYVNGDFFKGPNLTPGAALTNTTTGTGYAIPTFFRFAENYGISAPVLMFVDAGQQVSLRLFGPSGSGHIAGYVVDLTQ